MSELTTQPHKKIYINGVKVILSRSLKLPAASLIKDSANFKDTFKLCAGPNQTIREDVIFESAGQCDKLDLGEYRKLTLVNYFNETLNSSRTVLNLMTLLDELVTKTSDNVVKIIGQKNYDTIFLALCSVINQELKTKAILALLTQPTKSQEAASQTDLLVEQGAMPAKELPKSNEKSCQTLAIIPSLHVKNRKNRRMRTPLQPYVVKEEGNKGDLLTPFYSRPNTKKILNKIVIDPNNMKGTFINDTDPEILNDIKSETIKEFLDKDCEDIPKMVNAPSLPDISHLWDNEDSNMSQLSTLSSLSVGTEILEKQSKLLELCTEEQTSKNHELNILNDMPSLTRITTCDGNIVDLPVKPEDMFHLTTPNILATISVENKKKLLLHQAYIDWKYCLQTNEDSNLPIHEAVLKNDVDFLRRQCVVLKARHESVDIGDAEYNLSALQMGILHSSTLQCIEILLSHGADPLEKDDEKRTVLHYAAENANVEYLSLLIKHCKDHARELLDNNGLWVDKFEQFSDEDLALELFMQASVMFDTEGYSPIMLASKLGHHEHVRQLLQQASNTINTGMPNSGNTVLYLTVEAACIDAAEKGNKSKIRDNYTKTIETLLEYAADPTIDNFSGTNVNVLLSEFGVAELSMAIAEKIMANRHFNGVTQEKAKDSSSYILIKEDGVVRFSKNDKGGNKRVVKSVETEEKTFDKAKVFAKKVVNKITEYMNDNKEEQTIDKMKINVKSEVKVIENIDFGKVSNDKKIVLLKKKVSLNPQIKSGGNIAKIITRKNEVLLNERNCPKIIATKSLPSAAGSNKIILSSGRAPIIISGLQQKIKPPDDQKKRKVSETTNENGKKPRI